MQREVIRFVHRALIWPISLSASCVCPPTRTRCLDEELGGLLRDVRAAELEVVLPLRQQLRHGKQEDLAGRGGQRARASMVKDGRSSRSPGLQLASSRGGLNG